MNKEELTEKLEMVYLGDRDILNYLIGYYDGLKGVIELLKEENQELKKQLNDASIQIQEMIEQDIECPSNCSKLKELKKRLEVGEKQYNDVVEKMEKQREVIDKAIDLLGNYKHYSTPDEKQNSDNEYLVDRAYDILKEV